MGGINDMTREEWREIMSVFICPKCKGSHYGKVIYHGAARFYEPKDYVEYACPDCGHRDRVTNGSR